MHGLHLRAISESLDDPDKNNVEPIFHIQTHKNHAPEQKGIVKIPPFFRWWISIGYYGLFIPYKPKLDAYGCYKLQSNKLQKVNRIF